MKRHFLTDPETGAVETFEYDETEDKAYIHRTADVSSIIESNKKRQNDGTNGYTDKDRDMVHMAHIPIDIIYLWLTKYGVDIYNKNHMPAVKRLLNSNEWRYLRVNHMIM
ncbi:MAG TPA: hypothetical protein VHY35_10485 [Stellaceae bacterium]|jgi:hypothetical protein|nr:hypothetical protein [Stellaceae bacterium]